MSAHAFLPASRPPARSIPESLLLLLFILVTPPLSFAAPHPSAVSDPAEPVTITALTFEIENGRTSEKALRRFITVTEGTHFDSLQSAQTALNRDIQELTNLRVFRSVEAELQPAEGGHPQYQITYRIVDAFTFIPIPFVLYNSNAGGPQILYFQIWGNMFGSLIDSFSMANITLRPDGSGGVETGPWLFAPSVSNIKLGRFSLAFGLSQERVESSRWSGTNQVSSYRFDRTVMNAALETRFGPARRLYYTVGPRIELRYGYTDFIGLAGFSRSPLSFGIRQSIFYDSVDVFHNSRKGIRTGISGTLRMVQTDDIWRPVVELRGEAGIYIPFDKRGRFSFYPRLLVFTVFNDTAEKLGAPIRGIPNATMDGSFAIYLNQTLGIGLWQWRGVWDIQIHPWFDLALAHGGTRPFTTANDIRRSLGFDLLLFIERVPNLVLRFSWGFDLDPAVTWNQSNKREIIVSYSYSY